MSRKLKYPYQRRTKDVVKLISLSKEISKRTGFRADDVRLVIKTMIDIIIENLKVNKGTLLPKIGMFYPFIKPERPVTKLNGGIGFPEKMTIGARWILKFRPGQFIKEELLKITPTEEEIEDLYED